MASVQLPDAVAYKSAKLATLDTYPVGPTDCAAVALNVSVNGATPVLNALVPLELIVVFTRLSFCLMVSC